MMNYRVWLRTRPGFYAQYDGHVDVWAESEEEAEAKAKQKLRRTSFPDYRDDFWKTERIEAIGN